VNCTPDGLLHRPLDSCAEVIESGGPCAIRTRDQLVKSQSFVPKKNQLHRTTYVTRRVQLSGVLRPNVSEFCSVFPAAIAQAGWSSDRLSSACVRAAPRSRAGANRFHPTRLSRSYSVRRAPEGWPVPTPSGDSGVVALCGRRAFSRPLSRSTGRWRHAASALCTAPETTLGTDRKGLCDCADRGASCLDSDSLPALSKKALPWPEKAKDARPIQDLCCVTFPVCISNLPSATRFRCQPARRVTARLTPDSSGEPTC
jgi:hypothetical protein